MSIKELEIIDGVAQYDLIVIGSGSGNTLIGPEWDNKKVALIDGGTFGGTCLNVGCIPTKMFVYPATTAQKARELNKLGIEAEITAINWAQIRDRIFPQRIDKISAGGRDWRAGLPNVDYYPEYAHFVDAHTVQTESGQKLYGRQVVIAAGSRAVLPTILREVDKEVVDRFVEAASHQWNILLECSLVEIRENGDGTVTVVVEHDGEVEEIVADAVLAATGRRSNSDTLKASSFFDVDSRGFIGTDKYQRVLYNGSPVPGVFALGDVSSPFQLKHVANHEARTVQHNLSHPDSFVASDHRFVPAAVFSNPQIATVGLSEENARKLGEREGFEVTVKSQNYGDTAYGWAMEDSVGLAKLIARKDTGQLLGAHLVGEEASVLIQPLIQAMSFGLGVKDMARGQYWIHPALTEVIENALLGLDVDN